MKNNFLKLLLVGFLFQFTNAQSQDNYEKAKEYFSKFKSQKEITNLLMNSLPSLEDCKLVFKGEDALTFFKYAESIKSQINETATDTIQYVNVMVKSFTPSDINEGKGNYAGGMRNIKDKLREDVTFFEIKYLKKAEDEFGMSYKYWVKIDKRWVFLPKPYRAFTN